MPCWLIGFQVQLLQPRCSIVLVKLTTRIYRQAAPFYVADTVSAVTRLVSSLRSFSHAVKLVSQLFQVSCRQAGPAFVTVQA